MFFKGLFSNRYGELRSGWKIFSVVLLYIMFSSILSLSVGSLPLSGDASAVILQYAGEFALVAAVWVALKLLDEKKMDQIGLISIKRGSRDFIYGFLFGAVLMTLIFAILLTFGRVTLANGLSNPTFSHFLWSGLLLYIAVGFTEEIVFRGYFMTVLQQMNRTWLTVLISSLLFSFSHGSNPGASVLGLANIFIVGLLFAFMFVKTGNLWMPIGFHIAWNYFQGNIFGFPVSGTAPHGIYNVDGVEGALWSGGVFGPEGGLLATMLLVLGFLFVWWYPEKQRAKSGVFS